jgi:outer membrane protein
VSLRRTAAAAALGFLLAAPVPCAGQVPPGASGDPPEEAGAESLPGPMWDLETVVETALAMHPLVGQIRSETTAAAARSGQARAPYYPTVDISTGYARFSGFSPSTGRSISATALSVEAALTQVIADFGRRRADADRADALLGAARGDEGSVRLAVAFAAEEAYFDVLRTRKLLEVSRATVSQRNSLLRQAQAFYDAGIRARIDVARAEANLFQARAEATAAESALRVARITLLNRMGVDGPADFELVDTLAAESVPGTIEAWIREAEEKRPDLRALRDRETAAESVLRAARADYRPVLTGSGGYGYSAEDFPMHRTYDVSILLSVPVFSGFLTRERVKEAEASLESVRFAVTDIRRLIRLEVERAALAVREASERIEARRKEREASAENLRLAVGRYEVGVGDIIEMIDAQVQFAQAEASLVEAQYDNNVAAATLARAVGRRL